MGSKEIHKLEYRESFAFIGIMGEMTLMEDRADSINDCVYISQHFTLIPEEPKSSADEKPEEDTAAAEELAKLNADFKKAIGGEPNPKVNITNLIKEHFPDMPYRFN